MDKISEQMQIVEDGNGKKMGQNEPKIDKLRKSRTKIDKYWIELVENGLKIHKGKQQRDPNCKSTDFNRVKISRK